MEKNAASSNAQETSTSHTPQSRASTSSQIHDSPQKSQNVLSSNLFDNRARIYQTSERCYDPACPYSIDPHPPQPHFHCIHDNRCHYSTNHPTALERHFEDFHDRIRILDGYEYFDRNYDCKFQGCPNNKVGNFIFYIPYF